MPISPCYAARLLRPFLPLLGDRLASALEEKLEDPEHRLHASYVHAVLAGVSRDAGQRASQNMAVGDGGLLDFLMTSAPTPRAALAIASSHMRLLSDVHVLSLEDDRIQLQTRIEAPRAIDDFMLAWLLRCHVTRWHPELAKEAALEPGAIRVPTWRLDAPLPHRNRRLHAVLLRAADDALARLPAGESTTERVRQTLSAQLVEGSITVANVARELGQHPRTLSRALLREGTTFQALVARTRKAAALHWLGKGDLPLAEVARLSGFHSKAPFHRQFRRWTGETPQSYRRKQHDFTL